eukprot:EG_transcript_5415
MLRVGVAAAACRAARPAWHGGHAVAHSALLCAPPKAKGRKASKSGKQRVRISPAPKRRKSAAPESPPGAASGPPHSEGPAAARKAQRTPPPLAKAAAAGPGGPAWRGLTAAEKLWTARDQFAMADRQTAGLPPRLQRAIALLLREIGKGQLRRAAQTLSSLFRLKTVSPSRIPKEEREKHEKVVNSWLKKRELRRRPKGQPAEKETEGVHLRPVVYNDLDALAYIAHRLPSIHAVMTRILREVQRRLPAFAPVSVLDFGTGPATSIWVAAEQFPNVQHFLAVEPSTPMMEVAQMLMADFPRPERVVWRRFLNEAKGEACDLVTASYVLSELPSKERRVAAVQALWRQCTGVLVLVEPGTPYGADLILEARTAILEAGATDADPPAILAPCPHHHACPLAGSDQWCHFSQRLYRTRFQKATKSAKLQFEDERFSYIVFRRSSLTGLPVPADFWPRLAEKERKPPQPPTWPGARKTARRQRYEKAGQQPTPATPQRKSVFDDPALRPALQALATQLVQEAHTWPRSIRNPLKKKGHVILDLCHRDGVARRHVVARATRLAGGYRLARKSVRGDLFPPRSGSSTGMKGVSAVRLRPKPAEPPPAPKAPAADAPAYTADELREMEAHRNEPTMFNEGWNFWTPHDHLLPPPSKKAKQQFVQSKLRKRFARRQKRKAQRTQAKE